MRKTLDATIKNIARGGRSFSGLRKRIVTELLSSDREYIELNSAFLVSSLFSLERDTQFAAFRFAKDDWPLIGRLKDVKSGGHVEHNMLTLAVSYIAANLQRVSTLQRVQSQSSSLVLSSQSDRIEPLLESLDAVDKQSLLTFRLFAAANAAAHSNVARYFGEERHSNWVRQRLVYPLIFFTINRPDALSIDGTLLTIFPWLETQPSERRVVRYLLRPDYDHGDSLSFKCFVAMMSHPFDALEMLTDHLEGVLAQRRSLTESESSALEGLASIFPNARVASLRRAATSEPISFFGEGAHLSFDFELSETQRNFFEAFFSLEARAPAVVESKVLAPLGRMRWSRYPTRADFEAVVGFTGQYSFLPLGRLFDVALMSLYMLSRRTESEENRVILRCIHLFEGFTPFLFTIPNAAVALSTSLVGWNTTDDSVDAAIRKLNGDQTDRTWMKLFHWRVRRLEQRLRLTEYFAAVRADMRPSPNSRYLSGIDWRWVQQVMDALKIGPFRTPDAIYTLILRAIEERDRQPNYVRTALRPITSQMRSVGDLVTYLMNEYGKDSVAAIRLIITPEMILKMQLESYYAAALAERLDALTRAVEKFGFDDEVLNEEQFLSEQRTLSTALTLMNVHTAQFAVSWDAIRNTATAAASETYTAFEAINRTFNDLALLSNAIRTSALGFANRQTAVYSLQNRHWPAAVIVGQVIDAFLSHPSHGIESILAVRIRHDNLRYEFGLAIDGMRGARVSGIADSDMDILLPEFQSPVFDAVNQWVDRYMHTAPAADREALFDFVPSEKELREFVEAAQSDTSLGALIDRVIGWLQVRLSHHLTAARQLLGEGLRSDIQEALERAELAASRTGLSSARIARVKKALFTVLDKRCDELVEWFNSPTSQQSREVAIKDIKLAVDGRYRSEVEGGRLLIRLSCLEDAIDIVAADNVRLVFDIWSELAKNAMKYSGLDRAYLRVRPYKIARGRGFVFSALRAVSAERDVEEYEGLPSVATSAAIFKSGRSGLKKVAHLAASVAGVPVTVRVMRRHGGFHVIVPLESTAV